MSFTSRPLDDHKAFAEDSGQHDDGSVVPCDGVFQYLAAIISQFTGVSHEGGDENSIPIPLDTVHVYGDVFKQIFIAGLVSGIICLAISPLLKKWMHTELPEGEAVGGH